MGLRVYAKIYETEYTAFHRGFPGGGTVLCQVGLRHFPVDVGLLHRVNVGAEKLFGGKKSGWLWSFM
jgi:hypothetical protein